MTPPRVTVLSGGLGGARVALALRSLGLASSTCFVTNVGDDLVVDGLLVCPDTDAVFYALAGIFDDERGWGIRGDEFPAASGPGWFNLGDLDRAHHARRRALLDSGLGLSGAMAVLAAERGLDGQVVPATDSEVRTHVLTDDGVLAWQEWLVRDRAEPPVLDVEYRGAAAAAPNAAAPAAIRDADLVLFAPSSPLASVLPILAIDGYAQALRDRLSSSNDHLGGPEGSPGVKRTISVSPVVVRRPPSSERDMHRARARAALLFAQGREHTPASVAGLYREIVDTFVLDPADAVDAPAVATTGLAPLVSPGLTTTVDGLALLLRSLLDP